MSDTMAKYDLVMDIGKTMPDWRKFAFWNWANLFDPTLYDTDSWIVNSMATKVYETEQEQRSLGN